QVSHGTTQLDDEVRAHLRAQVRQDHIAHDGRVSAVAVRGRAAVELAAAEANMPGAPAGRAAAGLARKVGLALLRSAMWTVMSLGVTADCHEVPRFNAIACRTKPPPVNSRVGG